VRWFFASLRWLSFLDKKVAFFRRKKLTPLAKVESQDQQSFLEVHFLSFWTHIRVKKEKKKKVLFGWSLCWAFKISDYSCLIGLKKFV
jgi:hypothetical protein